MKKQSFYTISLLLSLVILSFLGCKTSSTYTVNAVQIKVDSTVLSLETIETLIKPYKDSLDAEMNEILVFSDIIFPKERGKPETLLGNFVADLSIKMVTEKFPASKIDFCLLNIGGLRTSLPKGEITRGKIFELMPFDNELVIVTLTPAKAKELIQYISSVGGQPISGLKLDFSNPIDEIITQLQFGESVKVLTSDYLANGGDKMNFFLNPVAIENIQLKLRDAIIEYCINEHKKGNKITSSLDGRLHLNQ